MTKRNLKGLTQDETDALRFILGAISGRDRFSNQAKRFLDGLPSEIDSMPTMKAEFEKHCDVIRGPEPHCAAVPMRGEPFVKTVRRKLSA